jgi:hypothetical protein
MFGKRTVKDGEAVTIWNRNGQSREVIGPKLVRLLFSTIHFLDRYTAGLDEYLVITKLDGNIEHKRGPCTIFRNPVHTKSIEEKSAFTLLASSQCVIINREEKNITKIGDSSELINMENDSNKIHRIIVRGPTVLFPKPGDKIVKFIWKMPNSEIKFDILDTSRRNLKFDIPYKGKNGLNGKVCIIFSIFINNVDLMIDNTTNLLGDLYDGLEVDLTLPLVNNLTTIEEMNNSSNLFSKIDTFSHFKAIANNVGITIESVVFRCFSPDISLIKHIDEMNTIQSKYSKECLLAEHEQNTLDNSIISKKSRLLQEESLEKSMLGIKVSKLEAHQRFLELEQESKINLSKIKHNAELLQVREKNDESLRALKVLNDMGVDLTKILSSNQPKSDNNFNNNISTKSDISSIISKLSNVQDQIEEGSSSLV